MAPWGKLHPQNEPSLTPQGDTAGLKVGRLEQLDRFHGGDSAPFGLRESLAAAVQGRPALPVVCLEAKTRQGSAVGRVKSRY